MKLIRYYFNHFFLDRGNIGCPPFHITDAVKRVAISFLDNHKTTAKSDVADNAGIQSMKSICSFSIQPNRGADRHRGLCKQAQLDCAVHGVRSSTLFWRVAPGQGAGRSQHRDSRRRSRRERQNQRRGFLRPLYFFVGPYFFPELN